MISLIATLALLIVILVVNLIIEQNFMTYIIPLLVGIAFIPCALVYLYKIEYFMNYYYASNFIIVVNVVLVLVFTGVQGSENDYYLLLSVLILLCTQAVEINFIVILVSLAVILVVNIVMEAAGVFGNTTVLGSITHVVSTFLVVGANLFTMRKCQISSKINFIINESFENETNHINDVLSILVPKFVKNHLERNLNSNDMGMQQEQKETAVLFCYICNFSEIVSE